MVAALPPLQLAAPHRVPAGSGAQAPALPATLQALQAPHEALWQQTWSVHRPLKQSVLAAQEAPSGFRLLQVPDWQL